MVRLGYKQASAETVRMIAGAQSDQEVASKEAFTARWRRMLASEEPS